MRSAERKESGVRILNSESEESSFSYVLAEHR